MQYPRLQVSIFFSVVGVISALSFARASANQDSAKMHADRCNRDAGARIEGLPYCDDQKTMEFSATEARLLFGVLPEASQHETTILRKDAYIFKLTRTNGKLTCQKRIARPVPNYLRADESVGDSVTYSCQGHVDE